MEIINKLVLVLLSLLGLSTPQKEIITPKAIPRPNYQEVVWQDRSYQVVKIEPKDFDKLNLTQDFKTLKDLQQNLGSQNQTLLFATNAGMFSEDFKPLGLHVENYQQIKKINLKSGFGNFHLEPNGVFLLKNNQAQILTSKNHQPNQNIRLATQSGPLLVTKGKINPIFGINSQNLHIRSGVGVDKDGNVYFVLTSHLSNFYNFANFFKTYLGTPDALFLDGSVSEFFINGKNNIPVQTFGSLFYLTSVKIN